MAAHRYWRVVVYSAVAGTYTSCARLELRDQVGSANLATAGAGTLSTSSDFDTNYLGAKAVDGNDTTSWMCQNTANAGVGWPQWIAFDFGAQNPKDIVEVGWMVAASRSANEGPKLSRLEHSDDGASWTPKWYLSWPSTWTLAQLYLSAPTIDPLPAFSGQLARGASYARWQNQPPEFPPRARPRDANLAPMIQPFRGSGYIAGTVTSGGVPASRPVRLYHRASGCLVAYAQSEENGTYRFDGLNPGEEFYVMATDADADHYNAAVADMILPATP